MFWEKHFLANTGNEKFVECFRVKYFTWKIFLLIKYTSKHINLPRLILLVVVGEAAESLPWDTRLKIAIGAAECLAFLQTEKQVVRPAGIKASDILLDRVILP